MPQDLGSLPGLSEGVAVDVPDGRGGLEAGVVVRGHLNRSVAERLRDDGVLAWIECAPHATFPGGDHTIVVGHVLNGTAHVLRGFLIQFETSTMKLLTAKRVEQKRVEQRKK